MFFWLEPKEPKIQDLETRLKIKNYLLFLSVTSPDCNGNPVIVSKKTWDCFALLAMTDCSGKQD